MELGIEVSSLSDLEEAFSETSGGECLVISVTRVEHMFEADLLLQRLQKRIAASVGRCNATRESLPFSRQVIKFYQKLVDLELHLQMMKIEVENGLQIKKVRFDSVRRAANEAVANSHKNSSSQIRDKITIQGQRISRIANLLGFADSPVENPRLADDDLEWFLAVPEEEVEPRCDWFFATDEVGTEEGEENAAKQDGTEEGEESAAKQDGKDIELDEEVRAAASAVSADKDVGQKKGIDVQEDEDVRAAMSGVSADKDVGVPSEVEAHWSSITETKLGITKTLLIRRIDLLLRVLGKTKRERFVL